MKKTEISHIIQRILVEGEQNAFSLLVDEYKDLVYSLSLKMSQSTEDAEEIAQDSFIKAFQGLKTFKGKSKFSTWLYQITYFTAINFLRKKKDKTTSTIEYDISNGDPEIWSEIAQEERTHYLNLALKNMQPGERAVITLFHIEEHSIEEVSKIMSLSKSNTKVSLYRARKKLYSILQSILKNELTSLV